ncbi:unnamed protein product, partial [Staurois parvus]
EGEGFFFSTKVEFLFKGEQGRTYHLATRALPAGPGSVGSPMRCPWYLS